MLARTKSAIAVFILIAMIGPYARASSLGYDPRAQPELQLQQAMVRAGSEKKLVLIIAGGEWCSWCLFLDKFIKTNRDIKSALENSFVVVKVYFGEDNPNEAFFSRLPPTDTAPHFWVLSAEGNVLASQKTEILENGRGSYDKKKFLAFIGHWKP